MFLKSLEIRGFKSFADKTELNFKKGITSVVGPNGSGKSNISDAVRWVLGEQSVKSLRGAKMEDVIFVGTQFRKPVGLAQVSLTLNNEDGELKVDYSEVKVTRRLYRSGESEYFINNTRCRLKDIQELFMDTGIGKEGYSLIGQGKIDAILSGRPEERRSLLEEAAGIVKFKTRKEEAEKKLENTNQNLIRIVDIIKTYEERLEPLRLDMEKAKHFLDLSTELKQKDIALIVHTINETELKIKNIKEEKNKKEKEIYSILEEENKLKEELEQYNSELEKHELITKENRELYYKYKEDINEKIGEIRVLEEKIKNSYFVINKYEEDIKSFEEELNKLIDKKLQLKEKINEMKNSQKSIEESLKNGQEELNNIKESLSNQNLSLVSSREEINLINNTFTKKESKKENIKKELKSILEKIEELKVTWENTLSSSKINNNTRIALEKECNDIKEKIQNYEEEIKTNNKILGVFRGKLKQEERKNRELNANLNKFEANLNILSNLEKQYEGYTKSVKNIVQHIETGKIKDVDNCYVLGDVINVSKEYEIAMEIALGGAISNIITNSQKEAKYLIKYLKDNNLGRATFLPLNIIRGKRLNKNINLKSIKGYIGIASELLTYDNKFKNAVEFLLGNVVIARDMDSALVIANKIAYTNRIVTLSGEVLNVGGSLTGGSIYNKNSNVISRKREIKELYENINNVKVELENISFNIKEYMNKLSKLDEHNLNLRDTIHGQNIDLIKLTERINSLKEEEERCNCNLKNIDEEIERNNSKINIYENTLENIESNLKELLEKKSNIENNIKELEKSLSLWNVNIEKINENILENKIKLARLRENLINNEKILVDIEENILNKKNSFKNYNDNIEENKKNIDLFKMEIEKNKENIKILNEKVSNSEENFKEDEGIRVKLKDSIKNLNLKLETINKEEEIKDREISKILMNLTRFETEYSGIMNRLNEDYKMTYAQALDFKISNLNLGETKEKIKNLKDKISSLGVVNVGAIEEYKEVKEKYTFMNSQKQDMEASKEEIFKVIEEMTLKMRDVFRNNFEKLNYYFYETFRELFKGGSASLILSEGDELNGKIDINVQPPGKKLQNINLMSGGEKVLSAIALLFSILKMKPTPFCILDEIEAALDDANVARYAEFLKKFSDKIQFIVITHRKGTMTVSDVLYGITMEEKGISKVVSVNLNNNA